MKKIALLDVKKIAPGDFPSGEKVKEGLDRWRKALDTEGKSLRKKLRHGFKYAPDDWLLSMVASPCKAMYHPRSGKPYRKVCSDLSRQERYVLECCNEDKDVQKFFHYFMMMAYYVDEIKRIGWIGEEIKRDMMLIEDWSPENILNIYKNLFFGYNIIKHVDSELETIEKQGKRLKKAKEWHHKLKSIIRDKGSRIDAKIPVIEEGNIEKDLMGHIESSRWVSKKCPGLEKLIRKVEARELTLYELYTCVMKDLERVMLNCERYKKDILTYYQHLKIYRKEMLELKEKLRRTGLRRVKEGKQIVVEKKK